MSSGIEDLWGAWMALTLLATSLVLMFFFPKTLYWVTGGLNAKILYAQLWVASSLTNPAIYSMASSALEILSWFITELEKSVKTLHGH